MNFALNLNDEFSVHRYKVVDGLSSNDLKKRLTELGQVSPHFH